MQREHLRDYRLAERALIKEQTKANLSNVIAAAARRTVRRASMVVMGTRAPAAAVVPVPPPSRAAAPPAPLPPAVETPDDLFVLKENGRENGDKGEQDAVLQDVVTPRSAR